MIKIIKQGREINHSGNFECACQSCGCIFQFDFPDDTKIIPVTDNETQRVIKCPCCGRHLVAV